MASKTLDKPMLMRMQRAEEITFADVAAETSDIQMLRVGAFMHPYYGGMIINEGTLSEMVVNFDNNVRRQKLPIDYFHESEREAAGWIKKVFVDKGGKELWATVEWTPKARQMLADKEVGYFSADFYFEWTDPETGVGYKNVLNGGGLVNRPFVKDMQPVAELSEGNFEMKTIDQLNGEVKVLGETVTAKDTEIKTLGEKLTAKDTEIADLRGKIALAEKEKKAAEKEREFAELCAKGKACAAQKEAFIAGDMVKFAELAEPLNTVQNGSGATPPVDPASKLSEADKKVCESLGLTHEEFIKANKL